MLARVAGPGLDGCWIHLDVDVHSPRVMPAVDSPEQGDPGIDELAPFIAALVRHPKTLGMEVTICDPTVDPDLVCAERLVTLLERAPLADASVRAQGER